LRSANFLVSGQAKLWGVIHPLDCDMLQSRYTEHLNLKPKCSQFIRHKTFFHLHPSSIDGISGSQLLSSAGDLIFLKTRVYYGFNLGINVAEAVNFADDGWMVPIGCIGCLRSCPCGDLKLEVSQMVLGNARLLHIDGDEGEE
jgi:hypothetical protein